MSRMLAHDLTDDPFKAALGNTRGTGQSGDDADDIKAAAKAAAERLDLNDEHESPWGAFIVIYPDGSFLENSETTGKICAVKGLVKATLFQSVHKARLYMGMCETQGGSIRKIDALLLEPLTA